MAARVVLLAAVGLVVGVASCATSQDVPLGLDLNDNIGGSTTHDAGAGGAPEESGGASVMADGGAPGAGGALSGGRGGSSAPAGDGSAPSSGGRTSMDAGSMPPGASGGSSGAAPADAGPACHPGEKICQSDGMCWPIAPPKGCDLDDRCTPCAAPPANGFSVCANQACDFDCLSGFRKDAQGTGCERGDATGGATGAGGTSGSGGRGRGGRGNGGSGTQCDRNNCPDCSNILEAPCCHNDGTCGCGLLGILCGN
jgi:hypothetical protein